MENLGQEYFTETQAQKLILDITKKYNTTEASIGEIDFKVDNAYIENSYLVTSAEDRLLISAIIKKTQIDGRYITRRTIQGLSAEWLGHNLAYMLNLRPSSTQSVNLDYKFFNNDKITIIGTIFLTMLFCY